MRMVGLTMIVVVVFFLFGSLVRLVAPLPGIVSNYKPNRRNSLFLAAFPLALTTPTPGCS